MKTKIKFPTLKSFMVLFALQAFCLSVFAASPEGDFKILKNKNGIDLYYRWMHMPDGKKVRQMKAVLDISGNNADVLSLLKNEDQALEWIPSAEQFRNLTQVNGPDWVSYIKFSVPWPFADQDCILEYTSYLNGQGETVIDFRCNPEYIEPVEGISRMKDIVGSFVIHPHENGTSTIECYFLSKKASVIPRWITEPIITGSILNLMDALRNELKEV